jgi:hypothetical protein
MTESRKEMEQIMAESTNEVKTELWKFVGSLAVACAGVVAYFTNKVWNMDMRLGKVEVAKSAERNLSEPASPEGTADSKEQ